MSKILAIDLGTTSFGYAVLHDIDGSRYVCLDNTVVMRDKPYNEKGESPQGSRAVQRSLRRLIEKRKKRIRCVAKTFEFFGILEHKKALELNDPARNPIKDRWELRAVVAWERPLSPEEFFAVFAHMAKHRGYKSIATDDLLYELESELGLIEVSEQEKAVDDERRQVYQALERLERLKQEYRTETVAQTIHRAVSEGKLRSYRNHDDYEKMIRREDIEDEIEKIVLEQSKRGSLDLSENEVGEFIDALKECITDQKMPTIDESVFGHCTFYREEKAAPKYSYLYDLYRLYKKLADLKIENYDVTPEDRTKIVKWVEEKVGKGRNLKRITYGDVRKILGLGNGQKIFGVDDDRIVKGKKVPRVFVPFFFLAELSRFKQLFSAIARHPSNRVIFRELSEILQFSKTPKESFEALNAMLKRESIEADSKEIVELFKNKKSGTLTLSHRYILEALPLFLEGMDEKEIQRHLGFSESEDYSQFPKSLKYLHLGEGNLFEAEGNVINNHAVKSLASWALGLIADLSWRYGPFDTIVVESAREVLPEKVRKEIEKAMKEREKRVDVIIEQYRSEFPTIDRRLARKIELWQQQKEMDVYSGEVIGLTQLLDGSADIEHIVPRSLGGLSSGYNTIVALKHTNADKGNRLPGDWLAGDEAYRNRVEMLFAKGLIDWKKRKNLLAENLDEIYTETFDSKGLRATSYLEALVAQILKRFYPFPDEAHRKNGAAVRLIPGRVTSRIRSLLKIKSKSRDTNFHHAEDALILATISRGWQNRLHRMLRDNYGKSEEELAQVWEKYTPHIEGVSIADYIAESFERFMSKGEESLFYRDMLGGLRTVSYWVDRKPLSASSHKETVFSSRHNVVTLRKNILGVFLALDVVKNRHKLDGDTFMELYNKEIRRKLWLYRERNFNDESYRAVERRAAQIAETIDRYRQRNVRADKEADIEYQEALRTLLQTPLSAAGKTIRRMRFVYEKLNPHRIDRGLVETDKNMLGIVIRRRENGKLSIVKIDVNNAGKMLTVSEGMIVYLNEMLYLFGERGLLHYGCLRSYVDNRRNIALFNPRFPANPKAQPKKFSTGSQIKQVGVGSAVGVIKPRIDLDGSVKSFQVFGEVTTEQVTWFKKETGYGGVENDTHL